MKFAVCLFVGLALMPMGTLAAGKSGDADQEQSWRLGGGSNSSLGPQQSGPDHLDTLPDAQELEKLLSRETSEDPEDLYRLGLAYENDELWEPDYKKAFSYFQRSEALGYPWAKSQLGYYYETGIAGPQDHEKAVSYYQQGADYGDSWSGLRLGYLYFDGLGIRQHDGQAFFWIQWASRGGVPEATAALGWLYENGRGTEVDLKEAARLYRKAGEDGNPNGWVNLGLMHETGAFGTQDYKRAADFYRKAADEQSSRGMQKLGYIYYWGLGGDQDRKRAVSFFKRAIDLGSAYAHISLGLAYEQGGGLEQDYAKAAAHYQSAIDAEGYSRAKAYLAWLYQEGLGVEQDLTKSRDLFEEAAAVGQPFALTELGFALVYGTSGADRDVHRGRRLLEQAAANDYTAAILVLAEMYDTGSGVAKDPGEALELYRKSADLGNSDAFIALGDFYADGDQVERDFEKALQLYGQALEDGNSDALFELGYLYTRSEWPGHDFDKAMDYFREADEAGVENAATFLGIAHFHGEWADEDDKQARAYFERAADAGYYLAAKYLAYMEEEGLGGLTEKHEAVRHYELAAEGDELFAAQRLMTAYGDNGWMTPNRKKALRWTIRAGELGDADAAFEAAEVLHDDPSRENLEKASSLYRVAADDGNLDASVKWARMQILGEVEGADYLAGVAELVSISEANPLSALQPLSQLIVAESRENDHGEADQQKDLFLGIAYTYGIVLQKDTKEATTLLRKINDVANPIPSASLALSFALSESNAEDKSIELEIFKYAKRSAELGVLRAQLQLAEMFEKGLLVEANPVEAAYWYKQASQHSKLAERHLAEIQLYDLLQVSTRKKGIEKLEDLAAQGDAEAAIVLAWHFVEPGETHDYEKSRWYAEKSLRFGLRNAHALLGWLNLNGHVSNANWETALSHLKQGSEVGSHEAMFLLGDSYAWGMIGKRDTGLARKWLTEAAKSDHRDAMISLGALLISPDFQDEADKEEGVDWLEKAAAADDPYGLYNLGLAKLWGVGTEKDPSEAFKIFQKVEALDEGLGATAFGDYYYYSGDVNPNYTLASEYYARGAKAGNHTARLFLAWQLEHGIGVAEDADLAAKLFETNAQEGHHESSVELAKLFRDGNGVPKDLNQAVKLLEKASSLGSVHADANLGWMVLQGLGVDRDVRKGLKLIEETAAQGSPDGLYYLAAVLEQGEYIPLDLERAIELYKKAADFEVYPAFAALKRLQIDHQIPSGSVPEKYRVESK
ncbi:MAG: hypothetical protein NXI02_14760 [Rhodobacteraceae bacterium]|nr:hypothetical protein [Paracoccaceae bacterium]